MVASSARIWCERPSPGTGSVIASPGVPTAARKAFKSPLAYGFEFGVQTFIELCMMMDAVADGDGRARRFDADFVAH